MIKYKLITVEEVTTKYFRVPTELFPDDPYRVDITDYAEKNDVINRWKTEEDYSVHVVSIEDNEEESEWFTDAYNQFLPLWEDEDEDCKLTEFYGESITEE